MGRFLVNTRELGDSADVLSTLSARLGSIRTDLANGWSIISLNTADDPKVRTMDPEGRFDAVSRRLVGADEALQGTSSTLRAAAQSVTAADRMSYAGGSISTASRRPPIIAARTASVASAWVWGPPPTSPPTTMGGSAAASVSTVLRQSRTAFAGGPNPTLKYMTGDDNSDDGDRSFGENLLHYSGINLMGGLLSRGGGYLKKKLAEVDVFKATGTWFMDDMREVFSGDWKNPTTLAKMIGWACVGVGVGAVVLAALPGVAVAGMGIGLIAGTIVTGSTILAAVHVGAPWVKGKIEKLKALATETQLESPDQDKTAQAVGALIDASRSRIMWDELLLDPAVVDVALGVRRVREILESDCLDVLARQQFYEMGIVDEPPGADELRVALAARARLEELAIELEGLMPRLEDWYDIAVFVAPQLTGLVYVEEGDPLPWPLRLKAESDLVDVRDMLKLVPGLQMKNEGSGSVDRFHQHIADEFLIRGVLVFLGESLVSDAWDVNNEVVSAIENGERVTVEDYEHALSFRDQLIDRLDGTNLADQWQGELGKDERIADVAALASPDCALVPTETQITETKELVKLEQEAVQLLDSTDPTWHSDLELLRDFREAKDHNGMPLTEAIRERYEESGTEKSFLDWLEAQEVDEDGDLDLDIGQASSFDFDISPERMREVREARDRLFSATKPKRWSELVKATDARPGHSGELAREGYGWVVDDVSNHNDTSYWTDSESGTWHDQEAKQEQAAAALEETQEKYEKEYEKELDSLEKATGIKGADVLADPALSAYLPPVDAKEPT